VRLPFQDEARFGCIRDQRRCWAPWPLCPIVGQQIIRNRPVNPPFAIARASAASLGSNLLIHLPCGGNKQLSRQALAGAKSRVPHTAEIRVTLNPTSTVGSEVFGFLADKPFLFNKGVPKF
jgi:hypothetical protein